MNITIRILLDVVLFLVIIQGWWFVALPLALIGAWRNVLFVELLLAGIVYDSLFGYVPSFGIIGYMGTIVSLVIFLLIIITKKVLRR